MKSNKRQIFRDLHFKRISLAVAGALAVIATSAHALDITESTKLGGTAFFDFTNIDQTTNGNKVSPSGTGIDVKRFYLTLDHTFDEMWSANLTTDFNYVANDSETNVFVKKAYVQAKLSDAFIGRLGSADMPWIPFVESLYGYRYVENTLIDRTKFGNSADWGLHAGGMLSGNMFSYALSVVNGNGYKNPSRSKNVDLEGRFAFVPLPGVTLALGLYNGKLGKDTTGAAVPTQHAATRVDAVAAYVTEQFRVGAEYFRADNWNNVAPAVPTASDASDGYSGWGSFNVTDRLAIFARYDKVNPSKDLTPALEDKYYNVGLSYSLRKNIDAALVYKHENVDGGVFSVSNGTIGSAAAGTPKQGEYSEIGLWAQVKF